MTTTDSETTPARAPGTVPALVRSPLARGRRYQYAGFKSGFRVTGVAFRGHSEDDGGLPGVAVKWEGFPRGSPWMKEVACIVCGERVWWDQCTLPPACADHTYREVFEAYDQEANK